MAKSTRRATAASAAKRRGKVQVKRRATNAVKRVAKTKARKTVRAKAKKGPIARLAAKTRKVLGLKKTTAKGRARKASSAEALVEVPPAYPM
jgi:hypothetical protein